MKENITCPEEVNYPSMHNNVTGLHSYLYCLKALRQVFVDIHLHLKRVRIYKDEDAYFISQQIFCIFRKLSDYQE